jgi:hypothetical protein
MPHHRVGDFELRFSSNDTCPAGVHREIVISSSPRGGGCHDKFGPHKISPPTPKISVLGLS